MGFVLHSYVYTHTHRIHIHITDKFWVVQPSYFSQLHIVQQFPPRLKCFIVERSWLRPRMLTYSGVRQQEALLGRGALHPAAPKETAQNLFKTPLKWARFTRLLRSQLHRCRKDCWKTHRNKQLPGRNKAESTCLVEAQANRLLKRTLPNLMAYLQAVQCSPGFQLSWSVSHVGVEFGDTTIFATFQISK